MCPVRCLTVSESDRLGQSKMGPDRQGQSDTLAREGTGPLGQQARPTAGGIALGLLASPRLLMRPHRRFDGPYPGAVAFDAIRRQAS